MKRSAIALAVVGMFGSGHAEADVLAGQQIIGVFSNPVFSGNILNDPSLGQTTFMDNSSSSAATDNVITNNGSSSSTLSWGAQPPGTINPAFQYSQLTFSGALTTGNSSQFQIGTISYLNGTSSLDSLIFGAQISFYAGSVSAANFLGSDSIVINTTNNQFSPATDLTQQQLEADADYINICGNGSNICNKSIEAYEDVDQWFVNEFPFNPDGSIQLTPVTANLFGTIVGDPQLTLTDVTLASDPTITGVIGAQGPLAAVPEPGTLALLSSALIGFGAIRRRRGKTAQRI